jgi:hypothetical protein
MTLGRTLAPRELSVYHRSIDYFASRFAAQPEAAKGVLAVGESPADPSFAPAELATWTVVASQFLNLDEFLTK